MHLVWMCLWVCCEHIALGGVLTAWIVGLATRDVQLPELQIYPIDACQTQPPGTSSKMRMSKKPPQMRTRGCGKSRHIALRQFQSSGRGWAQSEDARDLDSSLCEEPGPLVKAGLRTGKERRPLSSFPADGKSMSKTGMRRRTPWMRTQGRKDPRQTTSQQSQPSARVPGSGRGKSYSCFAPSSRTVSSGTRFHASYSTSSPHLTSSQLCTPRPPNLFSFVGYRVLHILAIGALQISFRARADACEWRSTESRWSDQEREAVAAWVPESSRSSTGTKYISCFPVA